MHVSEELTGDGIFVTKQPLSLSLFPQEAHSPIDNSIVIPTERCHTGTGRMMSDDMNLLIMILRVL